MKIKIKKGDTVKMLAGKDKGKSGKVLRVFPDEKKVVVEGLNLIKKHQRARRQGQKGQIITLPRVVDISNVMLICQHCKSGTRIKVMRTEDVPIRVCKKCGGEN